MKRAGVAALFALMLLTVLTGTPRALAEVKAGHAPGADQTDQAPPDREQMGGIGCITTGTAAAVVVGTAGMAALVASGGASLALVDLALPLLGTAFAAGCVVGAMAAPGAAWLIEWAFD